MGLEALGNIGEFVGAIAVVISMIYLAVQVRRNTQSVDASIDNTYLDLYRHWADSLSTQDGAYIVSTGFSDPKSLTDIEATRFGAYMCRLIMAIEIMHSMHSRGALSKERWKVAEQDINTFLGTPGGRLWWKNNRSGFTAPVVGAIDDVLARHDEKAFELVDWRQG
jgi:hypothetical protein